MLLYSGMLVIICVAWLVTAAGDQSYLSRVQDASSVYYQEFPQPWQKLQVEWWIYTREGVLALMIILAMLYGVKELWLHPWRTLRFEKVNNHHISLDDAHKLKEGFEKIAERRRWYIVVKTKRTAHNAVFVKTTKRRLAYCLKRLCTDQDLYCFSHPLKVRSDVGLITAKEHSAKWEGVQQKN
jgi:hypothetical protein